MLKKLLFVFVFLVMSGGCATKHTRPATDVSQKTSLTTKAPSLPTRPTDLPNFKIPPGIDAYQLQKFYHFKNVWYALYLKNNLSNTFYAPTNTVQSGVLIATDTDLAWKPWFTIHDSQVAPLNNAVGLWQSADKWHLLVIDDGGAGSGEGIAKLLESANGKDWKTIRCFYYGQEYKFNSDTSIDEYVHKKFDWNANEEYKLKNGRFYSSLSGMVVPECFNFSFKTIGE